MQSSRCSGIVVTLALLTVACASLPPVPVNPHSEAIAHFGINLGPERMTPEYLQPLANLGTHLTLRVPVHSQAEARDVLESVRPYSTLTVLLLIETPDLGLVTGVLPVMLTAWPGRLAGIELTNEPNIKPLDMTSAAFGAFVSAAYRQLTDGGFTGDIVSGGVSDCCGDFVGYVRDANLPLGVCKGWHLYADDSDQFGAIHALGCSAITEYGQPSKTPSEDAAQTVYLTSQTAAFQRLGASYSIIYQLVSGVCGDLSNLANFGLLDCNHVQKPAFAALLKQTT